MRKEAEERKDLTLRERPGEEGSAGEQESKVENDREKNASEGARALDVIDRKIIEILLNNARTPVKEIARQVFLSSPAVSARMEKLEKAGIIRGYHAAVDYRQFGYHIKAFINLEVEPYQKKEFYPYIKTIPNVIECSCVTGDYSMLIETAFQSTEQLDHFINELQHFGKTKTLIAFSTSVEHRDVPIE